MSRAHEAEYTVIGALLSGPDAYWRVADLLTAGDFADALHARLFALIAERVQKGQAADPVTLGEAAGDDVYDYAYQAARDCYAPGNVTAYAELVRKHGEARRLQAAGQRIALCEDYDAALAILASVRPTQAQKVKTVTDGLRELVDALQRRYNADGAVSGIPTSLASLDALTAGWQPGNLIVVAARPGMGKSAFAVQAALAAGRTFYSSLEMTAGELIERAVAHVGQLPHKWIRFPLDAPDYAGAQVTAGCTAVSKLPLLIDDSAGLSADAIFSRVRQSHMVAPLRLVVIDHLGLIRRPGKHDPSELGLVTSGCKELAKALDVPVMLLCQLNRALESRTDRRPMLSDLRDSGRIEEDADVVIGLYRDEYYNATGPLAGYCEAIVLKNRSGEKGTAWSRSLLSRMTLESCDAPEQPEQPTGNAGAANQRGGFQARSGTPRKQAAFSGAGCGD
jgi:replicative DNA helicase